MPALVRMLAGMAVRRTVATQGDAARLTGPQMNPGCADPHALFAFAALRMFYRLNRFEMGAGFHGDVLSPIS